MSRCLRVVGIAAAILSTMLAATGCGGDGDDDADFCADSCPAVVGAGCTNGPVDQADCLTGCSTAQTSCPTEFAALAACAGSSADFSCDGYDSPAPDGCAEENAQLQACLQGTIAFCYAVCPAVVAAGCDDGPSDVWDCLTGCSSSATDCPTEFGTLMDCAGFDVTFSCDAGGAPYPDGCQDESADLDVCLGA